MHDVLSRPCTLFTERVASAVMCHASARPRWRGGVESSFTPNLSVGPLVFSSRATVSPQPDVQDGPRGILGCRSAYKLPANGMESIR
eukprot:7164583-Prymnesium_polylepis.2